MRQISFLIKAFHNLSEYFVRLFRQCTFFKHAAVKLFKIDFDRIIQIIKIIHSNANAESVKHFENFVTWKPSWSISIEFFKYLLNWNFTNELLWKIQIAIIFPILILESRTKPFNKCGSAHFRAYCFLLFFLFFHDIFIFYS
jgi:hypothetical protein